MKKFWFVAILLVVALGGCAGPEEPKETAPTEAAASPVPPPQEVSASPPEKAAESTPSAPVPSPPATVASDAPPTEGGPKIECPEPTFNFGERVTENPVEHTFAVRNAGGATLTITEVKPGCGCTVAHVLVNALQAGTEAASSPEPARVSLPLKEDLLLEPGEEVQVVASLKLKGYRGPVKKGITVLSNDPEQGTSRLYFEGVAQAPIMMDPVRLDFGRLMEDGPHRKTTKIWSTKDDLSFSITEVDASGAPQVETDLKTVEEGKVYELTVTLKEPIVPGYLRGKIILKTDSRDNPSIFLPIWAQPVGVVEVVPAEVTLYLKGDPTAKTSMNLRVLPGRIKDFELVGATPPVPDMGAELEQRRANDYLVKLSDMPLVEEMDGKFLILKTNLPEHPEVKVPIKTKSSTPRVTKAPKPASTTEPTPEEGSTAPAKAPKDDSKK